MAPYNTLEFSNLQLNKLKLVIKNETKATLNLSSNMVSDSNNEIIFSHKLLIQKFCGFMKLLQIICQLT